MYICIIQTAQMFKHNTNILIQLKLNLTKCFEISNVCDYYDHKYLFQDEKNSWYKNRKLEKKNCDVAKF